MEESEVKSVSTEKIQAPEEVGTMFHRCSFLPRSIVEDETSSVSNINIDHINRLISKLSGWFPGLYDDVPGYGTHQAVEDTNRCVGSVLAHGEARLSESAISQLDARVLGRSLLLCSLQDMQRL